MTMPDPEHTEIIADQWYPLTTSQALRAAPLALERLGLSLVAWRDAGGHPVAQRAACPHRGANLALGRVADGCIECPYHGFRFDARGACVQAPCEGPDARVRKDMVAQTFPTREAHGLVWMWHGDGEPSAALPWFDDFDEARPHVCLTTFCWDVSLSRLVEGMTDMHHFPFAHRRFAFGAGTMLDPFEAHVDGDTVYSEGTLRHPEQDPADGLTMRFAVRFPATISVQLTPKVRGVVVLCPVDDRSTWGVIFYAQDYVTLPVVGKLLTWLALESEMRLIQPDDELMLLSSEPTHSHPRANRYVRADAGIAMWHKLKARASRGARPEPSP
jgi:phenylpropionate dioxygenase-like ring-hydroxylating dioxygenase large terminal subunit